MSSKTAKKAPTRRKKSASRSSTGKTGAAKTKRSSGAKKVPIKTKSTRKVGTPAKLTRAKPKKPDTSTDDLNDALAELNAFEEKLPDDDASPFCAMCNEDFDAGSTFITAIGSNFHSACFNCESCHVSLVNDDSGVYNLDGKPWCDDCYTKQHAKFCCYCRERIEGRFLNALEKDWHVDCLVCHECNAALSNQPIFFTSEDGNYKEGDPVYCQADYARLHGETCAACGEMLEGKILQALDVKWHTDCFCCAQCQEPLTGSFFVHEENVYCQKDYEELFATRCSVCREVVTGKCLREGDNVYHPDCFVCSHCEQPLSTNQFFKDGDAIYCMADYEKHYATQCAGCKKYVTGTTLHVLDKDWHPECFVCEECGGPLDDGFLSKDGKVYCEADYSKLFDIKCAGCDESLQGTYIEVLGFTWHKECFLCSACLQPVSGDSCYVQNNKVFCEKDFRAVVKAQEQKDNKRRKQKDAMNDGRVSILKKTRTPRAVPAAKKQKKARKDSEDFTQIDVAEKEEQTIVDWLKDAQEQDGSTTSLIALNLALGIATSLNKKRMFKVDYSSKAEFRLQGKSGMYSFVEFSPCIFQRLRQQYGIDAADYSAGLCRPGAIADGRIQSGKQLYFVSENKQFCIQSITLRQAKFFLKNLERYYRHVTRHQHTLLPRFFGMYKMRIPWKGKKRTLRFIVSNNPFFSDLNIHGQFELRKFKLNRIFASEDREKAREVLFDGKLYLGKKQGHAFKQQLSRDCTFLRGCNIINQRFVVGLYRGKTKSSASFSSQALMKGLHPTTVNDVECRVSIFQRSHGGTKSTVDGHKDEVYFFGVNNILQELDLKLKRSAVYRNVRFNKKAQVASESKKFNNKFSAFIVDMVV